MLRNTEILLGVTGGIAVYKSAELTRLLRREGARVHVVMTRNSRRFVNPLLFEALSENRVILDDDEDFHPFDHIRLVESASLAAIAPATANLLGKLASGIADDQLTTMLTFALGKPTPILLAPAMNMHMWNSPVVQTNAGNLRKLGIHIVGPDSGELACGDEGPGRMSEPEDILDAVKGIVRGRDLEGKNFLITAGPTREPLDPVRVLTNRSSGRMGYELARVAQRRGANVTLISGPTPLTPPSGISLHPIATAAELRKAVEAHFPKCDVLIMAAAVSDFRPRTAARQKQKKDTIGSGGTSLTLEPTPDILKAISRKPRKRQIVIGFAAEIERLIPHATAKLRGKKLDLIVANDISRPGSGFESATNQVTLIDREECVETLPLLSKEEVAERILDRVSALKKAQQPRKSKKS